MTSLAWMPLPAGPPLPSESARRATLDHVASAVTAARRRREAIPQIWRDPIGHDVLHGGIGVDVEDALVVGDEGRGGGLDVVATVAGGAVELEVGRHAIAVEVLA